MNTTRPRGATAVILDNETLLNSGRQALTRLDETAHPENLHPGPGPNMLVTTPTGNTAVVNGEGVGDFLQENDTIPVYYSYEMSWIPLDIPASEISAAATAQSIDIADGIRTHNARLDANHHQWYRHITNPASAPKRDQEPEEPEPVTRSSPNNPRFELLGTATAEDVKRPMAKASIMNQDGTHPWQIARSTAENLARQGLVAVVEGDYDNDASTAPEDPNSTQYTVAIFRPQDHQAYADYFSSRHVDLDPGEAESITTATPPPDVVDGAMGGACDYEVFRPSAPTGIHGSYTPLDQAPDRWGHPELN